MPLQFADPADYDNVAQGDRLAIRDLHSQIRNGSEVRVDNLTKGTSFSATHSLSGRQVHVLLAGGLINTVKEAS